ncbi:MAG: AI-2E family transporter [Bacillota bacterium]|nr:AI-2E family transporter [Bacillota bacterium]
MELDSRNTRRILLIIAFAVLLFLAVQNIAAILRFIAWILGIISPLLVGAAMAFVINVPMTAIERRFFGSPWKRCDGFRRRGGRPAAMLITLLLILAAIGGLFFLVIPEIARSIASLAERLPFFIREVQVAVRKLSHDIPALGEILQESDLDLNKLGGGLTKWLTDASGQIASMAVSITGRIVGIIFDLFMSLIFALYILSRKERLGEQARSLLYAFLPEARADRIVTLTSLVADSFANFLTGQVTEAFILAVLMFITNSLFRFPYALMISVLVGTLNLIPIFGAVIGAIIGAVLVLIESPMLAIAFLIVNITVQQFENNVIYPRTVGRQVGLPAMWVLAATVVGGAVGGVAGILLAIPLLSVLYVLTSHQVHERLKRRRIPRFKIDR